MGLTGLKLQKLQIFYQTGENMKVIANTKDGFLISATQKELVEIIKSVTGERPEEIKIGQKIPAIDYASTITKVKTLNDEHSFKKIFLALKDFNKEADNLKKAVNEAEDLEI